MGSRTFLYRLTALAVLALIFTPSFAATETRSGGGTTGTTGSTGSGGQTSSQDAELKARQQMDQLAKSPRGQSRGWTPEVVEQVWENFGSMDPAVKADFMNNLNKYMETRQQGHDFPGNWHERRHQLEKLVDQMGPALANLGEPAKTQFGQMFSRHDGRDRFNHNDREAPALTPASALALQNNFRGHSIVNTNLGDYYRSIGENRAAVKAYAEAAQANPRNTAALNGLSQSKFELGDIAGAVEAGRQVLEVDPSDAQARGMVKLYGDRAAASTADLSGGGPPRTSAVTGAPAPDFRSVTPTIAVRQDAGGGLVARQAEAKRLAEEAERNLKFGDPNRAAAAAEKALETEPASRRAIFALYRALLAQRNLEGALKTADRGLTAFPDDPLMAAMKSNALNLLGRYQEALSAADLGLQKSPQSPELLLSKGFALSGLGMYDEARTAFRQAGADARYAEYAKKALEVPDADLVAFFTGTLLGTPAAAAKTVEAPREFNWMKAVMGAAAGILLVFLGLSRSSEFSESLKRRLARLGSASPAVQAMPTPAPAVPHDGLAANGIRIEHKIGQGGMGIVYKGTDTKLDRPVAIKKMREEIRSDRFERERFLREAKTVASLRHPHIVEIFAIIEDGSDVYLVFEYVTGKTVHDLTYERGVLPYAYAVGVVRAVASALDYSHLRGVIHRDLKPSNMMVEEDGLVKVMDFGVARQAKDSLSRMSMTNTVVGTPPYMAPEQEQGIVRKESDVYALAVCLYEMVTGSLPFQGVGAGMLMAKLNKTYVPPSRVAPGLPAGFDAVLARAFDPDPDKRLRTAGELVAALDALPVA